MSDRMVRLHLSKKNHEEWNGEGTHSIEIDGVSKQFNHYGYVLEGRKWAGTSVESSLNSASPSNPDSYEHVADVSRSEFLNKTGFRSVRAHC